MEPWDSAFGASRQPPSRRHDSRGPSTGPHWRVATAPRGRSCGHRPTLALLVLLSLVAILALPACGPGAASGGTPAQASAKLRLGYFGNLTHAPAIVGLEKGFFADALGPQIQLQTSTFNAGPSAVEALFSGALDASFVGPSPAINAYIKSKGVAVRVVSGATLGGAALVVRPGIDSPAQLRGGKLASPQLGNTQDVALRSWLADQGLQTDIRGGGDVSIVPQENAQTLETLRAGVIDGAWVPEPWATRLVQEAGGRVLVDEASLWPGGRFTTTLLVVRAEYLRANPDVVRRLLQGLLTTNDFLSSRPDEARQIVGASLEKLTGKRLPAPVLGTAWSRLQFTTDPAASSVRRSADAAARLGLLERFDLGGLWDLSLLNELLRARGLPEVAM